MTLWARLDLHRDDRDRLVLSTRFDGADRELAPVQITLPARVDEALFSPLHRGSIATAMGLLPAMVLGTPLRVDEPVSARLRDGLEEFQRIQASWFPDAVRAVPLAVDVEPLEPSAAPRTATFFTGGVDSFFSLLRQRESIDDAVYVDGFDVPLDHGPMLDRVHDELEAIGGALDLRVLSLRSTARAPGTVAADWGHIGHGHALGSTALVLGAIGFSRVIVPSTASYDTLTPWGSHPLLDPLWSTEATEVVHDGAGFDRGAKIAAISQHDVVREHLRVCWERFDALNCSRCEKCLRTMSLLLAAGSLDRMTTFQPPRSLVPLARRALRSEEERNYAVMAARALRRSGKHRRLARSFERAAQQYRVRIAGGRPSLVEQLEQLPGPRLPDPRHRAVVDSVRPTTIIGEGLTPSITVSIGTTGLDIPSSVSMTLPGAIVGDDATLPGDLALVLALLPAMMLGAPLVVTQPVSGILLRGLETYQEVVTSWYPTWMRRVPIVATAGAPSAVGSGAVLLVDDTITAIATAVARSTELDTLAVTGRSDGSPANTATALGRRLALPTVVLPSLADELLGRVLTREHLLSGLEIGVQARLLGALGHGELLVAAPRAYSALRPAGSHPLTDPLWSTERLVVRHVDADRADEARDALAGPVIEELRRDSRSR